MPTFAVRHIAALREIPHRTVQVAKLLVDGESPYDQFCAAIRAAGTFAEELDRVDATLVLLSQGVPLPISKFKPLNRDRGDQINDYEIKTPNLRVYLFQTSDGKLVVSGGLANKTDQPKDIARMRWLKARFCDHRAGR